MKPGQTAPVAERRQRWARRLGRSLTVAVLTVPAMLGAIGARADVVTDWNATTLSVGGPLINRTLAMVHVAMFDAVNSIAHEYEPYAVHYEASTPTSGDAAAVGAAYGVLIRRFPAALATLDAARTASLAGIPDGPDKSAGLVLGDLVAADIVALRANDNMLLPNPPYTPETGPGAYQPTPPGFAAPINTGAPSWVPFTMRHPAQFRPSGPPALSSRRYARQVEEVQTLGALSGSSRTDEQTLIANWHSEQGQFSVNRVARTEATLRGFGLVENARLFALLNLAMMDAVQSVFEAKYHFNFWRPVTAIPAADDDGNVWTNADPAWSPLLVTPPHPEYPSAHSVVIGSTLPILEHFFGRHHAFDATTVNMPGVTRTFSTFEDFLEDSKVARIYGGIHFRQAVNDGGVQGKQLGRWVIRNFLRPRRCHRD